MAFAKDNETANPISSNTACNSVRESGDGISQIEGFLVALNIHDHSRSHLPPRLTEPQPAKSSAFGLLPSTGYLIQKHSDLQTFAHGTKETTRCNASDQPEFGGIDWQFMEEVRNFTRYEWRRFQASVGIINTRRVREMSSSYHNAEGLRNQGLLAFRETMLGHGPAELEKVFAMVSMSYIISKVLHSREALLESDILDGVSIWIKRISGQEERNIFNDIAQRLWGKYRTHLDITPVQANEFFSDFTDMNMNNSFQYPISFNYPAPGFTPRRRSPIVTSSVVSYNADQSCNGLAGPHAYTPILGSLFADGPSSLSTGQEFFPFDSTPTASLYRPSCTSRAFGAEQECPAALPSWSSMAHGLADTFRQPITPPEKAVHELVNTLDNDRASEGLQDSKSFCFLRAMFSYLDNSLGRLSGDREAPKANQDRLSSDLKENFRRCILGEVRNPLQKRPAPFDELSQAIKLVTAQFVDWNLLQTFDETRSFLTSVGKELISDKLVYSNFRNWIASLSASSDEHTPSKTPRRTTNVEFAGAAISSPNTEALTCPECGQCFTQRRNYLRHIKTTPHPRKYKRRARPNVEGSSDERPARFMDNDLD